MERTAAVVNGVDSVLTSAGDCRTAMEAADTEQLTTRKIARKVLPELEAAPLARRLTLAGPVAKSWVVDLGKKAIRVFK